MPSISRLRYKFFQNVAVLNNSIMLILQPILSCLAAGRHGHVIYLLVKKVFPTETSTAPARIELNNRTMPEQSQKAPVQPEKPLETPEQESGLIVQQKQKSLCEQNRSLLNHAKTASMHPLQFISHTFAAADFDCTTASRHQKPTLQCALTLWKSAHLKIRPRIRLNSYTFAVLLDNEKNNMFKI
jgi:hypothetical protein